MIKQTVIMPDILVSSLKDKAAAYQLTTETGVRLHFDISWAKLPLAEHYHDMEVKGEVWTFRSKK